MQGPNLDGPFHGRSGQSLRTGRLLVGGLSFQRRFGAVHEFTGSWAARRNSGPGHQTAADAGLGLSCSGGRTTACGPHALGGAQCGEQREPDFKHSETQVRSGSSCSNQCTVHGLGKAGRTTQLLPWQGARRISEKEKRR